MIDNERQLIAEWLTRIESSPDEIAQVIARCESDKEAREYFLWRASNGSKVSYTAWADQA